MEHIDTPQGRRIAYELIPGERPGIVFLGGFRSDMEGSKALHLREVARREGRGFLRFDYSGHGSSSGRFEDGSIGDWAQDAEAALALTQGPQILVGSSMGGWISLLLAKRLSERIHAMILIAPAPDFTENGFWAGMDEPTRVRLMEQGSIQVPSEYEEPYIITRRLIEEGRGNLVMHEPLPLPFPIRILQGTADTAVPTDWAVRLLNHMEGPDARLLLVKDSDHRFSEPRELALIEETLTSLS